MPYLHVKKSQNRILFTLCLGWHCADQPAVLSRTEADCDRSGLCQAGHRSVCLGTVALRLLSSKVLRLCQGLARGSHQGAPKHHPEPQANLLGLVRLEGTSGCSQVQRGTGTCGLWLLGQSSVFCTRLASPGEKVAATFTLQTPAMAQRGPSPGCGDGSWSLHGKAKRSHSPQDAPGT